MSHPRGIAKIINNVNPHDVIEYEGNLEITGDIGAYAKLTVTGSLIIRGKIHSHANITLAHPTTTGIQELPTSDDIYVNGEPVSLGNNHLTMICDTLADHVQITADIADIYVKGGLEPGCEIKVEIGSINAPRVDTDSKLQIANGNIHAGYLRGDVNISVTNKGNIDVIAVSGSASLFTANGSVHIQSVTPGSHIATNQKTSTLFIDDSEITQEIEHGMTFEAEEPTEDQQQFSPRLWRHPPAAPTQIKIECRDPNEDINQSVLRLL